MPADTKRAPALDFQRAYEEHAGFVYALIARLLGNSGVDPADLMQETFVVALRKFAHFQGDSPRSWLARIAVQVALAARRRARVRAWLGLQVPRETATWRTPEQIVDEREQYDAVYAALERLPAIKRTVFILFELQGFSGEEIAETLGVPKQTVYTRLHYARREFTRHFEALERRGALHRDGPDRG